MSKEIKHYMVIEPKAIFNGLEFRGTEVTISGEKRIWNEDSKGQSFPAHYCQEV